MKRLFTYILALSLLPQIASAVEVGKTEGTFAVSLKGAATYTIPLTIQKGMSDFKPDLSLFYDSNAENGIMGLGWSIKGLHTISKVNKCQHFDGTNQGKAYALDGMRMILGIGVDGQIGAMYKTEHEQGDIISITATQNGAPATFKVKAADGSIYKYGSSTGRYINGDNSKWALDYAQDALGNYISYTYDQNGGLYPTSITYGRNIHGTAGVDCVIYFTYDNSTTKRLTKIECKYNGKIYRSYLFNYAESPSRLISVTEKGRGATVFAPTTFEWEQNRIASITNGLGATDSYTYCNLNENGIYSQGMYFSADSPVYRLLESREHANIKGNIYVVKSRTESIPTDNRTTDYFYTRGIYHKNGKGFLGFEEITSDYHNGEYSETKNNLYADYGVLLPGEAEYNSSTSGDYLKWVWNNTMEIRGIDNVTYMTDKTMNGIYSRADGYADAETRYYSISNGLPGSVEKTYGFMEVTDNIIKEYWESTNDTIRIKGLPRVKETRKNPMCDYMDWISETTTYEREPNTGLVLKETRKRGEDVLSTDGYTYNEYGQVTQHYTVAYNSTDTLVTTYQYNTKGQLYKEYNPLGQYKTYSYDTNTGALSSVVEFDGSTTTYTYDGMLRETKCSGSSSIVTTTRNSANYGGSVYSVKVVETGKAPITTYYDAWERKVAKQTSHACGFGAYTDYKYNSIGKIGFVSFPHRNNETDSLGTYYYYDDDMNRLVRTEDSNGKVNTWDYPSWDSYDYTTCIDGISATFDCYVPDVINTVSVDSTNIQYLYNGDENIQWIKAQFGNDEKETIYEYDNCGRLSRTTDMNGVTKEYTYDQNGYPYETRIGDSYVITNYDKFGRLLNKTWYEPGEGSHTVNYTYCTDVKKKHLVAQEQGDDYTYTYTYNTNGRLINKRHSVTGDTQTHYADIAIQYNNSSTDKHLARKTCNLSIGNKNITERFRYRSEGLIADSLNNTDVWILTGQDNWGNVTRDRGPAILYASTYSYDDYGHMLSLQNRKLTDRSYRYDLETGNMIEKDSIPYTYDNKNRLTGWGNHTYSYDKMDNITSQPLIGTFSYEDFRISEMVDTAGYTADDSLRVNYYQAFERPMSIENDHYKAEFSYDGEGNRILMKVYKKVSGQYQPYLTRFYLDKNIEINVDSLGNEKGYYYAGDDAQTAPAVMVIQGSSYQTWTMVKDNTGSVIGYFREPRSVYEFSYNPWGVRTSLNNVTDFSMPGESLGDCPFYRTHKGYEDLWMFGLQFDKTRLYNPYMGRYLSPNPVLNLEGKACDHNPYVFSGNNPFRKPEKYLEMNPLRVIK